MQQVLDCLTHMRLQLAYLLYLMDGGCSLEAVQRTILMQAARQPRFTLKSEDTLTLSEYENRIRRLISLGGVDLGMLKEDPHAIASVRIGTYETGLKFKFICPECRHTVINDQEMEPMCTGPFWTDDHPPMVMERDKR